MDYLHMIKSHKPEKIALVDDGVEYTYGDLIHLAEVKRAQLTYEEKVYFIHEEKIADQLINFLAYSGTATVPVIATAASKGQSFIVEHIPEAACMGVMTSGSTGKSKLLWRSYRSWVDFFPEQNRVFGVDENTVIFCQGSLAFTGNMNIYMSILFAGATLIVTEKFRPKQWLKLMELYKVNTLYLIPSKLLLLPRFITEPNNNVRYIIAGSQTMGRAEADKLLQVFPNVEITLYYGASEMNYITYIKDKDMTDDRTDIGLPFNGVQVTVKDEEIFIDNNFHVEEIEMPFTLKDRGYLDTNGRLHFLGRTDDIIGVNGLKISSQKIEAVLKELPHVMEACVLSIHSGDADVLTAYLGTDGLDEDEGVALNAEKAEGVLAPTDIGNAKLFSKSELVQLLKTSHLEDHEIPKQYYFMNVLPKNESGKIDKRKLQNYQG
ncbi:MAG: AMP-binding protein [Phascolarctobacterium sp.]|nr:AMP-binding protein [Phascolarctobacterium sp.]